jgi:hypothetical protein
VAGGRAVKEGWLPAVDDAGAGVKVAGQRLEKYSLTGAKDGANPEVWVSEETGDECEPFNLGG